MVIVVALIFLAAIINGVAINTDNHPMKLASRVIGGVGLALGTLYLLALVTLGALGTLS